VRVLLVWPNQETHGSKPNSISLLSGLLRRDGHEVHLFDTTFLDLGFVDTYEAAGKANIFKPVDYGPHNMGKIQCNLKSEVHQVLNDFRPHLVAISAISDEVSVGLKISRFVKEWQKDLCVVWGNKGVTFSPEHILSSENVDYACIGEGIEFLPEFIRCLEQGHDPNHIPNLAYRSKDGHIVRNSLRPFFQNLDDLPYFDYSIYDKRQFLKPFDGQVYIGGDHMITWGCPNSCTYCCNKQYRNLYDSTASGNFIRSYSVDRIIPELKTLVADWGLQFFKFFDEDFCLKPIPYFRYLADQYRREIHLPFTIMAYARSITREKVDLLLQMGCVSVSMGFESGNEWMRNNILKRKDTTEDIVRATQMLNEAGIRTSSFNMLGLPFETRDAIFDTIELNRKSHVAYPDVSFFFPYEGTELYETSVKNGFWTPNHDTAFRSDYPSLTNTPLSGDEIVSIRDRFVFYVKFPKEFWPYIHRSETPDRIGNNLTSMLKTIYQNTVFRNNGKFPDDYAFEGDITLMQNALIN
jgi:anaerobic magnesium-protoporphyrin IX monomethyl ester cyclase